MSYFFSQRLTYCDALVPSQIAWDVFNQLGFLSNVVIWSNIINYDNPFVKNYRRCDQCLMKIKNLRDSLQQYKKWIKFSLKQIKNEKEVLRSFGELIKQSGMEGYLYFNQIEDQISHTYSYVSNQLLQIKNLNLKFNKIVVQIGLLASLSRQEQFKQLYQGKRMKNNLSEMVDERQSSAFESKCICLSRKDLMMFKKGIFRITRGNNWIYQFQIEDEDVCRYFNNENRREKAMKIIKNKIACLIVYQKGQRNIMQAKIDKFVNCLQTQVLNIELKDIDIEINKVQKDIADFQSMEQLTIQGMLKYTEKLTKIDETSNSSWLCFMEMYTKKEKQIYRALSTTEVTKNLVRFNIFISSKDIPLNIQPKPNLPPLILNIVETNKKFPSKFDTNQMLQIPQEILNTYGVPSYDEINPSPFYIVTFGFFIGVMFGDIGHMLMAIPLLIYFKANKWFWTVIFFMGYCGLIYNECFGITLGLFKSCYTIGGGQSPVITRQPDCVASFGIDSMWKVSTNQMAFTNSLKMKTAVIIGVVHMMFGLLLRLYNCIRRKKYLDAFVLAIPQIIFMTCTFVYMDYLIVYKWMSIYQDSKTAPSIISTMIAVFVNLANYNQKDLLFWPTQRSFQIILIVIAIICIPIMLFAKTIVIYCQRRKQNYGQHMQIEQLAEEHDDIEMQSMPNDKLSDNELKNNPLTSSNSFKSSHEHQQELKEIAVHQFIQTIQFVLGTVSNTASYLRLWALSLAHAQLSAVIFQLTILKMLEGGYSKLFGLFLIFPFFFATTFGVLICMDSLECFLHSLRLHWVQFQNKFYEGKGYIFEPFTFYKLK